MSDELQWLDEAMSWYRTLQSQQLHEVTDTQYTFFGEKQILAAVKGEHPVPIGESKKLKGDRRVILGIDPHRSDRLLVALNELGGEIGFYMLPVKSNLDLIYGSLVARGSLFPDFPEGDQAAAIQRDADVVSLKSKNKRETIVFMGLGAWDEMAAHENRLQTSPYTSRLPLAQATADGRDGAASQYYTAFSASLCSLIRTRALEKTLFYMHVDYVPAPEEMMHSLKQLHPENFFLQTLPNDLPVDVAGMLVASDGHEATMPQLIEQVFNNDFDSLLILCVLARLSGHFEDVFFLLASHPELKFRDHIAREAAFNRSTRVLDEVKKYGVSPDVLRELTVPLD